MFKLTTRQIQELRLKPAALVAIALALLACERVSLLVRADAPELQVKASFADKQSVSPNEQITLQLSRPLQSSEGRIAVIIGETDLSNLFEIGETSLTYTPKLEPFASGEHQVTVYLVSADRQWKEIARFPLRVSKETVLTNEQSQAAPKKNGSERFGFTPALTVSIKSQPAQSSFPVSNRPERATFTDLTLQGGIQSKFQSGVFNLQSQFDVAGSTYQKEALRFGQLGNDAPQIDLSNYLLQLQAGKAKIMLGGVAFGTNRYLINSFSSRGITIAIPITKRADFSFAAMNGTSIVGWDNFFGISRRKHQIISGTFGYEFIQERPGGLRVETGLLHGSLLPLSNFTQSNINDAEQSSGVSVRVVGSDKAQRFRVDAGLARSRFNNLSDPLLNRGADIVAVRETTRNARYFDVGCALMKDIALTESNKVNLTLNYRHERIDPLFRSLAAFVQPNKFQNQWEAIASIGQINATFSHLRFNDNLDNIPSILKSLTRRSALMIGAPLVSLFGNPAKPSAWLPRVSYAFDRTHQFGAFLPTASDFKPPQIPNQIGVNQNAMAEWQSGRWRYGYRFNHSAQDNFGEKRESTKLRNLMNGFALGVNPASTLDLNFDVNREALRSLDDNGNKDRDRTDRTFRFGLGVNWRMTAKSMLMMNMSNTSLNSAGDLSKTSRSRNTEFDLQWSLRFGLEKTGLKKLQGQFFIRYANRFARSENELFKLNNLIKGQTFNTGLSFTFF
jgi:hypothetical protein